MTGRIRTDEITGPLEQSVAFPSGMTFPNRALGNNVLDWYEEGIFTPYIYGGTAAGSGTYDATSVFGSFVRIGNVITLNFRIGWTAHTGTGQMIIGGIPYLPSAGGQPLGTFTQSTGAVPLAMQKVAGFCWMHGNGAVYRDFTAVNMATTGGVICSGSYVTG